MVNVTAPINMGFLSRLVAISFPGGPPRILVVECACSASPGNFTLNGESFNIVPPGVLGTDNLPPPGAVGTANYLRGPMGYTGSISLIPSTLDQWTITGPTGTTGPGDPTITTPLLSPDVLGRQFTWSMPTGPTGSYVSPDQSHGAAVAFFELDNINALKLTGGSGSTGSIGKTGTLIIKINTSAHGFSATPPAPTIWYFTYDILNGSTISGGGGTGQAWYDGLLQYNINIGDQPISAQPAVTNPVLGLGYGDESDLGFPVGAQFNPYTSAAAAEAAIAGSTYLDWFAWLVVPSTWPGQLPCSWTIRASTWRRQKNFITTKVGTLQPVGKAVSVATTNSGGANPKARTTTIAVNMASMKIALTTNTTS